MTWLVYGANGYTGGLVARRAVADGHRPLLAGRNGPALAALGAELGLEHRVFRLDDAAALRGVLAGVDAVAHCAGPFSGTAAPMVQACLDTSTHYLDITGETDVFEEIYARHDQAVRAGVVLLPGAGFDVVPTDCVAVRLARALPGATALELAFRVGGGMSRGTARTSVEGAALGPLRRVAGTLVSSRPGEPVREVDLPSGRRRVTGVRWGDLVSAYRSTGIPTITTYTTLPAAPTGLAAVAGVLLKLAPVRASAGALAARRGPGPDPATRARTGCEVWGEVRDAAGRSATATLVGPNPYDLTADALLRALERVVGVAPGAHTPATAFGPEFVELLDGVRVDGPRLSGPPRPGTDPPARR